MKKYFLLLFVPLIMFSCYEKNSKKSTQPNETKKVKKQEPSGRFVITYTTNNFGEISDCGCATLQLGGLAKRITMQNEIRGEGLDLLYLDSGDYFSKSHIYPEFLLEDFKKRANLLALGAEKLEISALAPGETDFVLGKEYLTSTALPYVSANIVNSDNSKPYFDQYVVKNVGGYKVAITGVIEERFSKLFDQKNMGIKFLNIKDSLKSLIPKLKIVADLVIVLAHVDEETMAQLVTEVAGIDFVISGHNGVLMHEARKYGNTFFFEAEKRGKYVGRIDFDVKSAQGFKNDISGVKKLEKQLWWVKEEISTFKKEANLPENASKEDLLKAFKDDAFSLKEIDAQFTKLSELETKLASIQLPVSGGFWHTILPVEEDIVDDPEFLKKYEELEEQRKEKQEK
ncbi:MAG: hypothetical protein ABIA04_15130 [Pseudomonadota bacterium]